MLTADQALGRLQRGNATFVERDHAIIEIDTRRRSELAEQQDPFAIILGCSDARVPAELIFNQGLGELFVIRVAGNIVAPSQVGSVEFAAEKFGTRLVVVLGHSRCGAVAASLQQLQTPTEQRSPNLKSIVSRISPALEPLLAEATPDNADQLLGAAVRANVRASVQQLKQGSDVLEQLIRAEGLRIVGAEYDLDTGVIDFFDV
ncbi:MAG: carbonic anhydrase [Pseudohongiellaceae bacterium]